jgi:Resolvase, N terminal domain
MVAALSVCRVYRATLIIARLDRLSRDFAMIAKLAESDTAFLVADFPEANRFTIHLLAAVAEYELKMISERIKGALAAAKARGVKLGGYKSGCEVSIRKAAARSLVVRLARFKAHAMDLAPMVCQLRDEGHSACGIAAALTQMDILTAKGQTTWYRSSVLRIFELSGHAPPALRDQHPVKGRSGWFSVGEFPIGVPLIGK